jgi:hypothetical protein
MTDFPTPQQKAIYHSVMQTLDHNHGHIDSRDAIPVLAQIIGGFIARGAPRRGLGCRTHRLHQNDSRDHHQRNLETASRA